MKRWCLHVVVWLAAVASLAATVDERRLARVAEAAFQDKLYDVAERQLAEFLKKFPESERADQMKLLLGRAQFQQGKWADAVTTLQEAVTKWPEKRPDSFRFWLAEALVRGGKFAEAAGRYREVVEQVNRSPYQAQALYGLAYAEFKQSRFGPADEALDRLSKLGVKGDLAQGAALLRGQIHLASGRFAEADAALGELLPLVKGTPLFYRTQYWLAESLARRKRFDDALARYAVVTGAFKERPGQLVDAQLAAEAWFATGWAYWQMAQFDRASTAFAATLASAQTPQLKRDALLKLGEALVRNGKLTDGVARQREFLQTYPDDPVADTVQLAIADLFYQNNDHAAALTEYARLITAYPQSQWLAKANFHAGACAGKLAEKDPTGARLGEALRYYQQAAKLGTDRGLLSAALFKVADAQFALGQFAEAAAAYQQLITLCPDLSAMDRALFQLGQAHRRVRNADGASAAFGALVEQFPTSPLAPEAQFELAQVQVSLGHKPEARAAFAVLLAQYGTSDWAKKAALGVGESFQREGKYEAAAAEFDKLIAGGLDNELAQRAFYSRGWCLARNGQAETTLNEFTGFLKANPPASFAPDVQFWIAEYYLKQKNYLKAQEQFQALATTYAASKLADSALYMAGRAAYARQDYKGAIELYEGVLKTFTNSAFRCDARFGEGDALSELGQFGDALLVFESLVKEFADCPLACEAQGRAGDCLYTLTRFEEAVASYRKALDCAKDATMRNQALFKMGQAYEKLTKLDDALQFYTRALYEAIVAPEPNEPPERLWAGKAGRAAAAIKEQQQQWRDAITLYEKLATACPEMQSLAEDRIRKIRVEHLILY